MNVFVETKERCPSTVVTDPTERTKEGEVARMSPIALCALSTNQSP